MRAENEVHVRIGGLDLLRHALLLHHASADAEEEGGILLAIGLEFADFPIDFLFRVLADGTRVNEDESGFLFDIGSGHAGGFKIAREDFLVANVPLAAERLDEKLPPLPEFLHVLGDDKRLADGLSILAFRSREGEIRQGFIDGA